MDALKIALGTTFVGALALPWIVLVIRFFFPAVKDWSEHLRRLAEIKSD